MLESSSQNTPFRKWVLLRVVVPLTAYGVEDTSSMEHYGGYLIAIS